MRTKAALILGLGSAMSATLIHGQAVVAQERDRVRLATFNVWELSAAKLAQVDADGRGTHPQLCKAAQIVQRVRPDVLLINEIDFDAPQRRNAGLLLERYLKEPQSGQQPVDYPYVYFEPVNTGLPTGLDLDNDGNSGGPADAFGFGRYEGQYGMALYSRFPIDRQAVRRFQTFKWKDMPGNLMPDGTAGKPRWYSPLEGAVLRLSSKSHWDVPLKVPRPGPEGEAMVVHVLASHPTPPVFDGPEDHNGRRNFDEIRFWADYVAGSDRACYIVDDQGRRGGLAVDATFVIMGDLNADPVKGERTYGQAAIEQLLKHARVQDPQPRHTAGDSGLRTQDSELTKTADFGRVDYVLPSADLRVVESGVFWPAASDPLHRLISEPDPSSDHRLVYVDIAMGP